MKIITIDKKNWDKGVEQTKASYTLTGPIRDKSTHVFRELGKGEQPDMNYHETSLSPKSFLFPQSEVMMTYTTDTRKEDCNLMKPVPEKMHKQAIIGLRPYDAKSFQIMKLNFDTHEYQDPYWLNAYNSSTFIGLADNTPSAVDFSTSCGTGPFDETGLDVLLVDIGDRYLAKVITVKGDAWMAEAGFEIVADDSAETMIEELKKIADSAVTSDISYKRIAEKTVLELFEDDHWETSAFGCINCGTCTYSCPTCWCFDIQDEVDGTDGVRMKNWDSCMSGLFTLHGSGHNPREHAWQRTRQRFMHKLKYFSDKYQQGIMCVGCGRCIRQCPANIDIREICSKMNA